jgi:ATP-dependent RNA helicase DDX5/DBP2
MCLNNRLYDILERAMDGSKVLIFTGTKKTADYLTGDLRRDGWPARAIHGDKSQQERDWVLAEFRSGKSPLMIATDVAARGIDVKDVKTVINYDFPAQIEDYVHRIGRTGRAGNKGTAFSFFTPADSRKSRDLIAILKQTSQVTFKCLHHLLLLHYKLTLMMLVFIIQDIPADLYNMSNVGGGGGFRRGGGGGGYGGGRGGGRGGGGGGGYGGGGGRPRY